MSDLGPLREWWKKNQSGILRDMGLEAALKAAGVIEDEPDAEPDVEKALAFLGRIRRVDVRENWEGYDDARRIIERARETT